jgi:hypothetical protein
VADGVKTRVDGVGVGVGVWEGGEREREDYDRRNDKRLPILLPVSRAGENCPFLGSSSCSGFSLSNRTCE